MHIVIVSFVGSGARPTSDVTYMVRIRQLSSVSCCNDKHLETLTSIQEKLRQCSRKREKTATLPQRYTTEFENFAFQTVPYTPQYVVLTFISCET